MTESFIFKNCMTCSSCRLIDELTHGCTYDTYTGVFLYELEECPKMKEQAKGEQLKRDIDCTEKPRIVHCKDCKWWDRDLMCVKGLGDNVGVCMQAKWFCGEEGFCLYGTKKEDE